MARTTNAFLTHVALDDFVDVGALRDRNMWFGLLAINHGLIDGPMLADALAECDEDNSLSVDHVLVKRGEMTEPQRQSIAAQVEQYMSQTQGNLSGLLSHVLSNRHAGGEPPTIPPLKLGGTFLDEDENGTQFSSDAEHRPSDTIHSNAAYVTRGQEDASEAKTPGERYQFVRQLSRGGLGVVSVAVDGELNREVAVKRIRPDKSYESIYREKFLREAQVTGNLEHPGVVPVYGMGTDALGNIFYAMRLIRGDTLSKLIEDHWRITPADSMALHSPRLLELIDYFLTVCQTINYAHRRGVLHRDLKPDNVMIGSYGETLVVDWGLAKVIGQTDEDAEASRITEMPGAPEVAESPDSTRFGAAMGTPAYASPEMIQGQILDVDRRSDIYGLGAILYEIFAGTAPITGRTVADLKRKAADGQVNQLRIVAPYVPKALAAICHKCLATNQEDRYQSVSGLINDLQRWKADQSVTALPDSSFERMSRWIRHHRSFARTGLAAIAGAALVAIIAGAVLYRQRQAFAQLAQTNASLAESEAAEHRKASLVRDLMVSTFRSPDPRIDGSAMRVSELLDRTADRLEVALKDDDKTRGAMMLAIGESYLGMGETERAVVLLRQATSLCSRPNAGSSDDQTRAKIALARALRASGSFGEAEELMSQTLLTIQANDSWCPLELRLFTTYELGETRRLAGHYKSADELFNRVIQHGPDLNSPAVLASREGLAAIAIARSNYSKAEALLQDIYKTRCDLSGEGSPDAMKTQTLLLEAWQRLGMADRASEAYQTLLTSQQDRLGKNHLETLTTQNNLAFALRQTMQIDAATELFAETRQALIHRLGAGHPATLVAANNLAESYEATGRYDEAVELLEQTIEQMNLRLPENHPDGLVARHNLARVLGALGRYDEAIEMHQDVLSKRKAKLGEKHLDSIRSMVALASALVAWERSSEARKLLTEAHELLQRQAFLSNDEILKTRLLLSITSPENDSVRINALSDTAQRMHGVLGPEHPSTLAAINAQASAMIKAGDTEDAASLLQIAHQRCREKLGETHPQTLIMAMNLGIAYRDAMQLENAIPLLEKTVSEMRKVFSRSHPHTLRATGHLAQAYDRARWYDSELPLLVDLLEMHVERYGESHRLTLQTQLHLITVFMQMGKQDEARRLLTAYQATTESRQEEMPPKLKQLEKLVNELLQKIDRDDDEAKEEDAQNAENE